MFLLTPYLFSEIEIVIFASYLLVELFCNLTCTKENMSQKLLHNFVLFGRIFTGSTRLDGNAIGKY